jgi:hypothetical protein
MNTPHRYEYFQALRTGVLILVAGNHNADSWRKQLAEIQALPCTTDAPA